MDGFNVCLENLHVQAIQEEHCKRHETDSIKKRECLGNMLRERRDRSWSVESLLHAAGRYAPKSDSTPLRQSQSWESPYLFSSHQINNNILLWTKTLSVSLCLSVSSLLRSPVPPPHPSLALSLSAPWQLFVSLLLSMSTCLQLLTQLEASSFFLLLWIVISPPHSVFSLTCVVHISAKVMFVRN